MPGLLPLLYNRRHLGVMMFTLALAHGADPNSPSRNAMRVQTKADNAEFYMSQYYPGVPEPRGASAIEVAASIAAAEVVWRKG